MVVNGQIMQTIKTIWSHWGSGSGYVQECEQMDRFFVHCLTIQNFAKYYPNLRSGQRFLKINQSWQNSAKSGHTGQGLSYSYDSKTKN